jgi:hypothetical protein
METFTKARRFVENPLFDEERRASVHNLDLATIDPPIVGIVKGFLGLSYCFRNEKGSYPPNHLLEATVDAAEGHAAR